MQHITITLKQEEADFESARQRAREIAATDNPEAEIISWHNRDTKSQSPCCLRCDFDGVPGWEVFGKNHGGRLKIDVNEGQYVFITS